MFLKINDAYFHCMYPYTVDWEIFVVSTNQEIKDMNYSFDYLMHIIMAQVVNHEN